MGKYLKQGFVRALEWQLARAEISHSKMVELMEEECIKNYKAEMKEVIIETSKNSYIAGYLDNQAKVDDSMSFPVTILKDKVEINFIFGKIKF